MSETTALADLIALAKAYERWEADIILDDECWPDDGDMVIALGQDHYDRMMELQTMRNAALEKAGVGTGKAAPR